MHIYIYLEQFYSFRETLFSLLEQRKEKFKLIDGLHILRRPCKFIVITIKSFPFPVSFFQVGNLSPLFKELSQLIL